MTTIASDGKTVAADGQASNGAELTSINNVKITVLGDCVLGFEGLTALRPVAFDWWERGADPAEVTGAMKDQSWGLGVFSSEGVRYFSNDCPYPSFYAYPFAMGTGESFAAGALLAGADSLRAVEVAVQKDIYTGGKITVLEIPREEAKLPEAAE
jgi:ATP-dependent protease HslVU (ClpYQ) peptidase subunit